MDLFEAFYRTYTELADEYPGEHEENLYGLEPSKEKLASNFSEAKQPSRRVNPLKWIRRIFRSCS